MSRNSALQKKGIGSAAEMRAKLKAMGPMPTEKRNAVVCALVGHSRIQEYCFGYFTCGRCGAQVGDSLGSVYDTTKVVIVGHDCPTCRANFAAGDWRDTLYAKSPFPAKAAVRRRKPTIQRDPE